MDRYAEMSERIFSIFARVTPLVQPISLDEAFLDVTACQRLHGDPVRIAKRIRKTIRLATGLTASVGVASCRFAAKIASDLDKPDGLTVIPENELTQRLAPLPVGKIWGVGPVTRRRLSRLGIETIGQLSQWPEAALTAELGTAGREISRLARGLDDSPVIPEEEEKSLSCEHTFARDVLHSDELENVLLEQAERVSERLRKRGLAGRTVVLKLRYADFTTITRRRTLAAPTRLAETIWAAAVELLRRSGESGSRPVRLIGVGAAGLSPAARAAPAGRIGLFPPPEDRIAKLERLASATDGIRDKLGAGSIQRASLRFREGAD
jgi:DNA polymerase-4